MVCCVHFGNSRIELVIGQICSETSEAIVYGTHGDLLPGDGINHLLYLHAGPAPYDACQEKCPYGLNAGESVCTGSGRLEEQGVIALIHVVGPDCRNSRQVRKKESLLRKSIQGALTLAKLEGLQTLSFSQLDDFATGFAPEKRRVEIFAQTLQEFLQENPTAFETLRVVFVQDSPDYEYLAKCLGITEDVLQGKGALSP